KQCVYYDIVIYKYKHIIINDKAKSKIDLESEHMIQEALEKLAATRTTFIVAHRLATITHADRIVVIEHGQITESGTHEALLRKRGSYYDLYQVQDFGNDVALVNESVLISCIEQHNE